MALVVITITDTDQGADVGVLSEPPINTKAPRDTLTPAQLAALQMLGAFSAAQPEPSRILTIN